MLVLVYRRFLAVADQLTATMICLGIVMVFAFQQLLLVGNYNYITPYCHEVFHGLVLSIVAVMWLSDWVEKGRIRSALVAGLTSGLVFLTKPDVFLALMVCAAAAFMIVVCFQRRAALAAKSLVAFLLAGLIPLLAFFALFLRAEDWQASARSVVVGVGAAVAYGHYPGSLLPVVHGIGRAVASSRKDGGPFYSHRGGNRDLRPGLPAGNGIVMFKWVKPSWLVWPIVDCAPFGFGRGVELD